MLKKLKIGEWIVCEAEQKLISENQQIKVEPLLISLLLRLAEQPNEVVTKEDLTKDVWLSEYVTDQVMAVAVYNLRKILQDNAKNPNYIQTVPRRGYRLIAEVSPAEDIKIPDPRPNANAPGFLRRLNWGPWFYSTIAALMVFSAGISFAGWYSSAKVIENGTLTVLPFENLTPDDDLDITLKALRNNLVQELSYIQQIKVVGTNSATKIRDPQNHREVKKILGAEWAVYGKITRNGDAAQLDIYLIDTESGENHWHHSGPFIGKNFYTTQNQVSRELAKFFDPKSKLLHHENNLDPQVYQKFLQVIYRQKEDSNPLDLIKELEPFEQDMAGSAEFYRAIARAHLKAGVFGVMKRDEAYYNSRRYTELALKHEPDSPETYMLLGAMALYFNWNPEMAMNHYNKARELGSESQDYYEHVLYLKSSTGAFDEAWALLETARTLEPLVESWDQIAFYLAFYELDAKRGLELLEPLRITLNEPTILLREYPLYRKLGDAQNMRRIELRLLHLEGVDQEIIATYKTLQGKKASHFCFQTIFDRSLQGEFLTPARLAPLAAYAGDREALYRILNQAMLEKDPRLIFLNVFPAYEPYRHETEFQEILNKIGINKRNDQNL